jgi:hypothetical protein
MSLTPQIEGAMPIKASKSQFNAALRQRIENGFLTGRPGSRSNYQIVESQPETIQVRAVDWWTAINVGLNDLNLSFSKSGKLHFRLQFWRWAIYCLALCSVLGLMGVALFLALDIRSYIANNAGARIPGLSNDQNLYLAWGMLLFWGFVWPWILIAFHKRPLRKLLAKLVSEIDAKAIKETPLAE